MKVSSAIRSILIMVTFVSTVSCGKSIKEAQDFVANKPPVIDSFTIVDAQGNAVGKNNLVNNMTFSITARAHDPEGKPLQYNFSVTNGQGSFTEPVITDDTCTSTLTLNNIVKLESLSLNLSVVDAKKASANQSKFLGSGKNSPTITITQAPKSFIKPGDTTTVSFSIDGDGYYQLVYQPKASASVPSFDEDKPSYFYNFTKKGSFEASRTISGPAYSGTTPSDLRIATSGDADYNTYIIIRDYNNLEGSAAVPVSIDGTAPSVSTTSLAAVDSKGQISIECTDASGTGETVTATGATLTNTSEACTIVSANPSATTTGGTTIVLAPKTDWWITAPGTVNLTIQDAAGNSATLPVTVPAYTSDVYVRSTTPSPTYTADGTITRPYYGTANSVSQGISQMNTIMTAYPSNVIAGNVNIAADGILYTETSPITISKNISLLGGWKNANFAIAERDVRMNQASIGFTLSVASSCISYTGTGSPLVEGLNLKATSSPTSTSILSMTGVNPIIRCNKITSTSGFSNVIAIASCGSSEISGNFILSYNSLTSISVSTPASTTLIRNNCIYATTVTTGVLDIEGGSSANSNSVFVQNNSIYSNSTCVTVTEIKPYIDNNLFFCITSTYIGQIKEGDSSSTPAKMRNNFFGVGGFVLDGFLYGVYNSFSSSNVKNKDEPFNTIFTGNIPITDYMTFITDYLSSFSTISVSGWHFTAASPPFTNGGLDLSNSANCPSPFDTDFDGKTRPSGSSTWSLGAFQYP